MLKALWKKIGAELWEPGCGRADIPSAPAEPCASADIRVVPQITHTGEFHLERLAGLLRSRYGKAFAVADDVAVNDHALIELIGFAARIQDQDVQRELLLFYLNCSPVIQEYLKAETPLGQGSFFGG